MSKNTETEETEKKTDNGLAATVRKQGKTIEQIKAFLEKMFGVDIDKDGKSGRSAIGAILAFAFGFALVAGATTIWNLRDTANTYDVVNIDHTGKATFSGLVTSSNGFRSVGIATNDSLVVTKSAKASNVTVTASASVGGWLQAASVYSTGPVTNDSLLVTKSGSFSNLNVTTSISAANVTGTTSVVSPKHLVITNGVAAGWMQLITNSLVWIIADGSVTNVIDVDVGTP